MDHTPHACRQALLAIAAIALVVTGARSTSAAAQELPPAPTVLRSARAAAPVDLTGYWVSVVTEDWVERMMTPPRGEYAGIPLSPAGRQAADGWDPAKDQASGNACRAYGAGGVMRQPGRLHITWQDDNMLKMETEAGTQTRLFRFGAAQPAAKGEPQWQGLSAAQWTTAAAGGAAGEDSPGGGRGARRPPAGAMKVTTTDMRAGYLRLNGIPYASSATLTEYFDRVPGPTSAPAPGGASWLIVFSVVEDSVNLLQPFITSTHYKLEPDGSKWKPRPCETTLPIRGK